MYTVTNPAGTVSVTVCLDGRAHRVELAPKVTGMTERELADEIRVIADLARQKARSQLHALIVEGVRVMGYDPAIMRDGLRRELDMPTPEEAAETAAEVFASRYSADHEQGDS
jgi:F420-0:gamma-glutamyl ligase